MKPPVTLLATQDFFGSNQIFPSSMMIPVLASRIGSTTLIHWRVIHSCRTFVAKEGGGRYRNDKKQPSKQQQNPPRPQPQPKVEALPRILPRPPGEKPTETAESLNLPDKDKEQQLSQLQVQVQTFYKSGQYQRALSSAEELLKDTIQHFGEEHPATAAAFNNTGLMRKLLGEFDSARKDYEAARRIYQATVGPDHASYASALHNIGNLNRSQIHFDTTLKATDRLSLVETALEYLHDAYRIRRAELGDEHPHTVASRSSRGATIAAQILHHHKLTVAAKDFKHDPMKQNFYVSLLPKNVTESAWNDAIDHLRQALDTAIRNPRGSRIGAAVQKGPKKGKKKRPAPTNPTAPQTLSAAAAAQNLAVVLKARATTTTLDEASQWLLEAEKLYEQALSVQTELLGKDHPDVYVTKHSLAELWHVIGKEDKANELRQEIVDTYDPPTKGEPLSS